MQVTRSVPVFFLGHDSVLADKLREYYRDCPWAEEYGVEPRFEVPGGGGSEGLPADRPGLVYVDAQGNPEEVRSLVESIRSRNPKLQIVLMVDPSFDYFALARSYRIGNLIRKDAFDADLLRALSIRLMTGNIFGFAPYFPRGFVIGPLYRTYRGEVVLEEVLQETFRFFQAYVNPEEKGTFKMFLHELLMNTFAYALEGITPEDRDSKLLPPSPVLHVPDRRAIKASLAVDDEKIGFSIQDSTGNLSMLRILEKLRRQSCIGDEKLPPGIWDESGRGMSLVHKYSRFIVNILTGVRTETIFLQYRKPELNRFESVIITEVTPELM